MYRVLGPVWPSQTADTSEGTEDNPTQRIPLKPILAHPSAACGLQCSVATGKVEPGFLPPSLIVSGC